MKLFKNKALLFACFVFCCFIQDLRGQKQSEITRLLHLYKSDYPKNDSAEYELFYQLAVNLKSDSSLIFAEKIISKSNRQNNFSWNYNGHLLKGNALYVNGKFEDAAKSYFLGAEFAKKAKLVKGIGIAYTSLGNTYYSFGNYLNAIHYYKESIAIFRQLSDSVLLANSLLNIGNEYLKILRIDSALLFLKEAQYIFCKKGHELGIAYSIGNIGFALGEKGNITAAEENILLATKMLTNLGDYYSVASYMAHMVQIYNNQNQLCKALSYANIALDLANKYGFRAQIRDVYSLLSEINNKTGNYKNAYKYHLLYIAYRDSINNNESTQKIADLRTTYEVAQKQTEIDLLNKRKNIQRIVAGSLGGLVIISGFFGFVAYRNNRKTKVLNNLLHEQKEELQAQHEQLEGLNKTKDRFFSIISHDLRGPIGSIGSLPELFKEYIAMNEIHEISELVVSMDTSVRQVSTLLDNLLEWALSQQGTFPYRPDKIYLNKVTEEVFSIFSAMAEAKGLILKESVIEDIYVIADKNSLLTILRNLLSNAIKFCRQGDTIILSARIHGKMAKITVADTGIGMNQEKLKTLFQLNEKKSTWGTENEKGLGIGLNLVHEFVQMNNGTIEVVSEENCGSTFIVKIPCFQDVLQVDSQSFVV